ncbi:MAG: L,D-transpeptidase [Actinomycetota bacterium]|nr:L,D-transpeptidase [Actinomycetota bacterium]
MTLLRPDIAVLAVLAAALVVLVTVPGGMREDVASPLAAATADARSPLDMRSVALLRPLREARSQPTLAPGPHGAIVLRRTQLRTRPGGRVVRTLGTRTVWGSRNVLGVVERREGWIGVLSDRLANSRVGWIPAGSAKLVHEPYTMHIDVSARSLVVRHGGRVARRVKIAVGRPGSTTPLGRFAITDLLRWKGHGAYGCCAMALTARQPNIPQGWSGGDRIGIHGTPNEASVGAAVTAGCMRAKEADMQWMLKHVRLGAPVRVRA